MSKKTGYRVFFIEACRPIPAPNEKINFVTVWDTEVAPAILTFNNGVATLINTEGAECNFPLTSIAAINRVEE